MKEVDINYSNLSTENEIKLIDILVEICREIQNQTKLISLMWINTFLKKYMENTSLFENCFNIDNSLTYGSKMH